MSLISIKSSIFIMKKLHNRTNNNEPLFWTQKPRSKCQDINQIITLCVTWCVACTVSFKTDTVSWSEGVAFRFSLCLLQHMSMSRALHAPMHFSESTFFCQYQRKWYMKFGSKTFFRVKFSLVRRRRVRIARVIGFRSGRSQFFGNSKMKIDWRGLFEGWDWMKWTKGWRRFFCQTLNNSLFRKLPRYSNLQKTKRYWFWHLKECQWICSTSRFWQQKSNKENWQSWKNNKVK